MVLFIILVLLMWQYVVFLMGDAGGRKLNHKTLEALRIRAVQKVMNGEISEVVIKALGMSRARIYE